MNSSDDRSPWVRRAAIGVGAVAVAAAITIPVVLTTDDDQDSPAAAPPPTPVASPTSATPEPEPEPEPEPVDDVIPPAPLDLGGVTVDLDGDGTDDELRVDTLPNTDGVTTSYVVRATLTSTGKEVTSQMTGETPNYVSFKGVVDADGDGRDEIVLIVTPGGDEASAHVHGLVGRNLQLLQWADGPTTLVMYESGDEAANIWTLDGRLLSGTTTNGGADWQMWEWAKDGPALLPTSLGTSCGEQPADAPPLDAC
jgi:hypothetical protein